MAFSVYEVVRVHVCRVVSLVCLRPVVSFSQGVNKLTTWQTSHVSDFVNDKSHAREKPLLAGYTETDKQKIMYWWISREFSCTNQGSLCTSDPSGPSKTKSPGFLFRGDGGCTQAKDGLSQFNFKFRFEFERRPNELYSFSKPVKELHSSYRNSVVMKVVTLHESSGVVVLVCS